MAGKIIEIIVLLAGLLLTAAIVISIPMKSYNEYKDYLAQIEQQNEENKQNSIKPVIESITVELKEGIRYFANDLAAPKAEHFTVIANYVKGEEKYSEPVEEGKFNVSVPADFYAKGGEIKISYKGASATIDVELVPVVVESLKVLDNPYTVKYAEGSTFDAAGMVIQAVYNDGSSKIVSADEYVVDTQTKLTTTDKTVTVSYQIGDIIKTVDVEIGVSKTLDNGAVKSIAISNAIVNAGDTLDKANLNVIATYESGNRKALSADEYTISGSTEAVKFGKAYQLTVKYNDDTTKTATSKVTVRQTLQGENGVIVGGKKNTEPEYVLSNGVITELGTNVSFAGNFSKSVTGGSEGSLTLVINAAAGVVGNITMRCGNSYLVGAEGNYSMQPLQINTILDLTVNGRVVEIPDSVVLKGCGPWESYAPLYGIYYEFTFEGVQLDPGVNEVKFSFKKSTEGALNCWNETPSTMNIDYVNFDSVGAEIPDNYEIEKIEITDALNIQFKQPVNALIVPVVGYITGGAQIGVDPELYDVKIVSGNTEGGYFHFDTYTIEVSLKDDPSVKASKEYTVPVLKSFVVLKASIELVDGKVYYVFSGNATGYKAEDVVLFDGGDKLKLADSTFTEDTFVLKYDVTDRAFGTFYPHMSIQGKNYVNGANTAGDIRDNGLTFVNGQNVVLNGKKYTINKEWSMPTLVVSEAPIYVATKDNSYESNKTLIGNYVWGSEGVTVVTGTQSKPDEYVGGIGGLDKANASVTYTFTISEDGKVDFIWNIAGNQWNGSGNDGIANMAAHMTITIDGKPVEISGISLPAGSGTAMQIWWNMQQVVIKDVQLSAGTHTFKCVISADGAGLNAGAMEIYFAAN